MNKYERNALALNRLNLGDFKDAQVLFSENVQKFPDCLTFNNLGYYYYQFGIYQKNGNLHSAKKLGLHYLLKAAAQKENPITLNAIAEVYFTLQDHKTALRYYVLSLQKQDDIFIKYNIGVCQYCIKDYNAAIITFRALINNAEAIISNGGTHPQLACAFCYAAASNADDGKAALAEYCITENTSTEADVFILRVIFRQFELAYFNIEEVLKQWYPTDELIAALAECILHLPNKLQSSEYQRVQELCGERKFVLLRAIRNPAWRMQVFRKLALYPVLIKRCCYYGCKMHNVPNPLSAQNM